MPDGHLFGALDKAQKQAVIRHVAKEAAKRFEVYVNTLTKSVDFAMPNTEEKLLLYQARLPEVWARIAQMNPAIYEQQMNDWVKLEMRSTHRRISPNNPFNPLNMAAQKGGGSSGQAYVPDTNFTVD